MRTKTALLTAALLAAGIGASMAQSTVYSLNVVGYVNVTVPANKYILIQNPLDTGNNIITNVITDPNFPDSVTVFPFGGGKFLDSETYLGGVGWLPGTNVLNPGHGFFLISPVATNITFVGSVVTSNSLVIPTGYSLIGSAQPVVKALGDLTTPATNTLNFPSTDGDTVFQFINSTGKYRDAVQYLGGLGWIDPDGIYDLNGPIPAVGEAFFVSKATAGTWTQTFNVGP